MQKLYYYDWLKDKAERGEEIKLTALLIDTDNSPLLKKSAKKAVEDGGYIEVEDSINLDDPQERAKIDRMFSYHVNKYALNYLISESKEMIAKAAQEKAMFMEFSKMPNVTKEQIDEMSAVVEEHKKEAMDFAEKTNFIKVEFQDEENVRDFIDNGTVWFRDDKQLALDVLDEIKEVKDEEVNNFITASALVHKIDELISRINHTLERLDMFIKGEVPENDIEIEGVEEMGNDDKLALSAEEAEKEHIEPTKLEDLDPEEVEREQKVKEEQEEDMKLDVSIDTSDLDIDDKDDPAPAASTPAI